VELHQFRIEAGDGEAGLPTPEGAHRDGVDWVIVMLVDRHNVASGVTDIFANDGARLGAFTLERPRDAVFLDDHRVLHGVTAIHPLEPGAPARRDVLVATFRREGVTSRPDPASTGSASGSVRKCRPSRSSISTTQMSGSIRAARSA
jgi:hypothetical protein